MTGRLIPLGLCLLFNAVVAAADDDDAFLLDKKQFKKQVHTIALTPVEADGYFDMPEAAAAMIERQVTERLEKRGYTVIPSAVLGGIRQTMEQQVGGTTDPITGELDFARAQAVRSHAFRELWFQHDFDALANLRVSISRVPVENDRVEWHGVKQDIPHEGRSPKYTARVYVSSVTVGLYDASFAPLYYHQGGIEPLMYRGEEQLEARDPGQLFRDEKKIREAAEIAVDPF
jgi:hypothetical protein